MRIGIVHFSGPPVLGGVEKIIEAHTGLFLNHGHRVRLIVGEGRRFDKRIELFRIPELAALHPEARKIREELGRGRTTSRFDRFREEILGKLRRACSDLDLVIIHNVLSVHFNLPATAGLQDLIREGGRSFIFWCHDCTPLDPSYSLDNLGEYPWSILRESVRGVRYVAISTLRQKELAKLWGIARSRITVVPDGADEEALLDLDEEVLSLFRRFDLKDSDVVMLLPARVLRRKNIELGVKVLGELKRLGKRGALLVTGPPDPHNIVSQQYYEELLSLAEDLKVARETVFLFQQGFEVNSSRLRSLYLLSDVLFLPSLREGFGIPLLEAGLARLPIFCSEIDPLTRFEGDGPNYFSLQDRPQKIALKISEFVSTHPSSRMFKRVMRNYTWSQIYAQKIAPLIEQAG